MESCPAIHVGQQRRAAGSFQEPFDHAAVPIGRGQVQRAAPVIVLPVDGRLALISALVGRFDVLHEEMDQFLLASPGGQVQGLSNRA